jgi:hypothetical protein
MFGSWCPRDFERATDLRQGYPTGGVSIHVEREPYGFFPVGERSCRGHESTEMGQDNLHVFDRGFRGRNQWVP